MAVNGKVLKEYTRQFLIPKLRPGQYVVFDNINFHKSQEMVDLIKSPGANVVFFPPYSPDLSPIEKLWSKMKEFLRRSKPRTKTEFHTAFGTTLSSMNDGDFEEWYENYGYSVV